VTGPSGPGGGPPAYQAGEVKFDLLPGEGYFFSNSANISPVVTPPRVVWITDVRLKVLTGAEGNYQASLASFQPYINGSGNWGIACMATLSQPGDRGGTAPVTISSNIVDYFRIKYMSMEATNPP
jgi:hypothetical protein